MEKKSGGLEGFKNIIWALGIYGCLAALLVGLVISLTCKFYGEKQDGVLYLGDTTVSAAKADKKQDDPRSPAQGELAELKKTQDQGMEHVLAMTFLCDRSAAGLRSYTNGSSGAKVWTDDGSGLPVVGAAGSNIVFPGDGSHISPVNAAMISEPARLVIYLGGDDAADTARDTFIQSYEELISQLRGASPDTVMICCSVASPFSPEANTWIETVCRDTGAYYADLASVLGDGSGHLSGEYDAGDGRTLNSAGLSKLIEYFRFHGVK